VEAIERKGQRKIHQLGFDGFPRWRVTPARDGIRPADNTKEDALTGRLESEVFVIDNTRKNHWPQRYEQ